MHGDLSLSPTTSSPDSPPEQGGFYAPGTHSGEDVGPIATSPGPELTAEQADELRRALAQARDERRMMSEEQRIEHMRAVAFSQAEDNPEFARLTLARADREEAQLWRRRDAATAVLAAQAQIADNVGEDGLARLTQKIHRSLVDEGLPVLNAERFIHVHQGRLFRAVDGEHRPSREALEQTAFYENLRGHADALQAALDGPEGDLIRGALDLGVDLSGVFDPLPPPVDEPRPRPVLAAGAKEGRHDSRPMAKPGRRTSNSSGDGSRGDPSDPDPPGDSRASRAGTELKHIGEILPAALKRAGIGVSK